MLIPELLIVGHATIDNVILPDGQILSPTPGGNGLYAAVGCVLWSRPVGVCTVIGKDYPINLEKTYASLRIDLSGIVHIDKPSLVDWAYYYKDGSRNFIFDMGLLNELTPRVSDLPESYYQINYTHLSGMALNRQLEFIQVLKKRNRIITLDTAPQWIESERELIPSVLSQIDFFMPSIEEVKLITQSEREDPPFLFDQFKKNGCKIVIVKLSNRGAILLDCVKDIAFTIPIYPVQEKDVTGAGDSFCGGFLAGYMITNDMITSCAYGATSASFIVESIGAIPPNKFTKAEAQKRLNFISKRIKKLEIDYS